MTVTHEATYTESATIPKEPYVSREYLALEYVRLWPRVWQMACRLEELAEVGDYVEYSIGDQSVIIVRTSPSSIKGFQNSCLHQGTRICVGTGHARQLLCPFHGWCWNLDGDISEVPDIRDFSPRVMDPEDLRLTEVAIDTWGGFVFVNFSADPEPLLDFLAPIPERLAPFEWEKMRLIRFRTSIMDCNWKLALHSFNEAYHVESTHSWDLSGYARDLSAGRPFVARSADTSIRDARKMEGRDAKGSSVGSYQYSYEVFDRHDGFRQTAERGRLNLPLGQLGDDPREVALGLLRVQLSMNLAHQDEVDYVAQLPDVPPEVPALQFLTDVRRAVARTDGVDFSHITDDDLLANIDYFFYPNMIGPGGAGNWIIYRARPNGMDPDSCIFDVMALHRFAEGETPPLVEHEWYPDWRDHDWYPAVGQHFATMGRVQAGMHQRSFRSRRVSRMEAGNLRHHRFVESYVQD